MMKPSVTVRKAFEQFAILWLGAAILAFGLYNIHSQTRITEGGVLGMTLLLQYWFGITPGVTGLCLDAVCYFLGYRLLGKKFLIHAVTASCGFSFFYNIYERIGYVVPDLTAWPFLAAVLGGIFVGVGVGMIVRKGGASGGDDALALVISKVTGCRIAFAYFATDLVVLLLSLTYIPMKRIAFSLITVTISSGIIDLFQKKTKQQ